MPVTVKCVKPHFTFFYQINLRLLPGAFSALLKVMSSLRFQSIVRVCSWVFIPSYWGSQFLRLFFSGFPPQNRLSEKELARTDPLSRQLVQVRYALVVHKQIHPHYWPALANFVSFRSMGRHGSRLLSSAICKCYPSVHKWQTN